MNRITSVLLAAFTVALPSLHAQELGSFTLPVPFEGARYSIGVFEGGGILVRTLASDKPEGDFPKALNGLTLRWDGKGEDAETLPPGEYEIAGIAIPELKVSGVQYHFNDWIDDSDTMKVVSPIAGFQQDNGALAAVVTLAGERYGVAWYDPAGKFTGLALLPEDWPPGATAFGGGSVLISSPNGVATLPWGSTQASSPDSGEPVMAMDFGPGGGAVVMGFGNAGTLGAGGGVSEAGVGLLQDALRFAHSGGKWLGLAASGSGANALFAWQGGKWVPAVIPGLSSVSWVTSASDGGFWVAGSQEDGSGVAVQVDGKLEPLRVLEISEGYQPVFVSQNAANRLVLIEKIPGSTRFRALRFDRMAENPAPGEGPVSIWQETFSRTVSSTEFYAVKDGMPVPSTSAGSPPPPAKVALKANPLSTEEKPELLVSAAVTPEGVWVSTSDGLLIGPIGGNDNVGWAFATVGDQPGTVRIFEGTVFGIAEYSVSGLENIVEIDIGTVKLPFDTNAAPE